VGVDTPSPNAAGFRVHRCGINPDDVRIEERPYGVYVLPVTRFETTCLGYPTAHLAAEHRLYREPPQRCVGPTVGATLVGPSARPGFVCRNCPCNFKNALVNRHGAVFPKPKRGFHYVHEWWDQLKRDAPWRYGRYAPETPQWWYDKWPDSKRTAILRSEQREFVMPWRVKANLKRESGHKPWTKARMIQAYPNMATQSKYGPMMYALQKSVFDWLNNREGKIRITVASGSKPEVLADWMTRVHARWKRPYFRERDGKNWDSTMGRMMYDLFLDLCRSVDADFARFVEDGYAAVGTAFFEDGMFQYRLMGGTKSGFNQTMCLTL